MNIFSANFDKNQIQSEDWFNFEKQFLLPLSLTAIFFSAISVFLNVIMSFKLALIVIPLAGIGIFGIVYFMAKKNLHVTFAKWLFIITSLILINVVWYYNYGARGPWFFLIILVYSYLIFMMSGRQLLILSIVLVLNVLILFFYEETHPNALGNYSSNTIRLLDFYSAILLTGATAYVLMTIAKRSYLTQYKKASIINNSNETLLQLIDDILDVSMIEANQVKITKSDFSVNNQMKQLETTYLPIIKKKKQDAIQLKLNLPEDSFWINSDQIRINQVMVNLLSQKAIISNSM